jgi:hypothetical protein
MTPLELHKMLSFGHCDKVRPTVRRLHAFSSKRLEGSHDRGTHWLLHRILQDQHVSVNGQVMPIGHYGNGFKSGSMRLGKDALVFTKSKKTQSVGLLSQVRLVVGGDPSSTSSVRVSYSNKPSCLRRSSQKPTLRRF